MRVERVKKKILEKNEGVQQNSYRLASRTTTVLFDPAASDNRSVLGSNKTAVVLEPSQLLKFSSIFNLSQTQLWKYTDFPFFHFLYFFGQRENR